MRLLEKSHKHNGDATCAASPPCYTPASTLIAPAAVVTPFVSLPVTFPINLFIVVLIAEPPVVSAIGILVVIGVGWPEAVTGAAVAPPIVVPVFVAEAAGRFGIESSIVVV